MTSKEIMRYILVGVGLGVRRIHNRYLPEVLALVCQQKLILVRADQAGIEVELA